ncbi:MAG: hypothetical protein HY784_18870 [Chloroflexi bacterium]|nr:hypothetical protein [Chloroflexota bacterium]
MVSRLRAERAARPAGDILVVSPVGDPELDNAAAALQVLLRGEPVRFVDGRASAVFPAHPAWVLLWPEALPAGAAYPLGERFPLRAGEGAARLVYLSGQEQLSLPGSVPPPRLLANGVDLVGYRVEGQFAPGGEVAWWLGWLPGPAEAGDAYHFFIHVLAADGQRVAGADGPGFPSGAWREGDRVIGFFRLQLAPGEYAGPYRVAVGMYRYPSLESVPVLDEAGNPHAPAVTLGPFP